MASPAVALVTGAASGIGRSTALALAAAGFQVAVNDLQDNAALDAVCEQVAALGGGGLKLVADVGDLSSHARLLDRIEEQLGALSCLVNNAGVSVLNRGDLLSVSEQSYDRCMAINSKALFFLSQQVARHMLAQSRQDGRFYSLVHVTSANARAVAPNRGEYCASKAAAAMISQLFAVRLGAANIAVYDVQPGLIETAMSAPSKADYQRRIATEGLTVLPRMGQAEEIGALITTLASGGLPYTTGQVLAADAGLLIRRF